MIPSVYRDDRGWTYMVRGGIGLQDFKGFYNKPGKDGWHGINVRSDSLDASAGAVPPGKE